MILAVFGVFSLVFISSLNSPKLAYAAASSTVNFQARLQSKAGAIVPDGDYNVEFKLYNASTSSGSVRGSCTNDSHCLWVETRTGGNVVHVVNGYLTVQLGSVNAFGSIDWTQNLWLTMNIGGTSTPGWDGEMDPRLPLTAVPYAFAAGQLQTTNGSNTSKLSIQAPTGGNQTFQIQDQGAAGTYNILATPGSTTQINSTNGNWVIQPATTLTNAFQILSPTSTTEFKVDTQNDKVVTSQLEVQGGFNINVVNGALTLGGTSTVNFHSPGSNGDGSNGADIPTKINVPIFNAGAYGQVIALGINKDTPNTARVITVLDARREVHQPSINLLDVGEDQVFGLSWDGANCNSDPNCVALLKTSASRVGLQSGGVTGAQLYTDSVTSNFIIGASGSRTGLVTLQNSSNSNTVSIKSGTVSTSYTILLPTSVGSASQCLSVSSVASQVETLAHSGCFVQGGSSFGAAASLGTGDSNVLNLVTNGTTQATIAVGGATTFKNSTDSTNAFQIQNNSGASLFNADTVNNAITLGPSTNLETTGNIDTPFGGIGQYQNLLVYSEQLDHDTGPNKWDDNSVSGPATSIHPDWSTANPAPDGSGTADLVGTVSGGGWLSQATATAATNDRYTFSFWAKSTGGTQPIEAAIDGAGSGAGTIKSFVATPNWQRFSVTQDTTGFTGNLRVTIYPGTTGGPGSIGVWGVQLVKGTTPQVYVRTTSSPIGASQGVVSNGSVYANGSGLFTTGSTTAFQVQNASGAGVFTVDTSGGNVNLGSNVNLILSGSGAHVSNPQGRTNSEAFGAGASVLGNYAVAVGNVASAGTADGGVAIGYNASTYSYGGSIAIGDGASARDYSVVIGAAASVDSVDGQNSVSIGTGSSAVLEGVTIGNGASSQSGSIAIGYGADASGGHSSIALGHQAAVTGWNQLVIGSSSSPIYNVYIGNGVTNAAPVGFTLQATSTTAGTSNVAGGSITIAGGQGTGTGNGGNINFQIAKSGTTGSSQNGLSTVASISGATGAAMFQNAANSTTAFQVQKANTNTVLDVDTTNGRVGIGTNAPSRDLHIASNTSSTNTPQILIDQAGSGDSTIEFKNSTTSFYVGQDTSNSGAFIINSSAAASSGSSISYVQGGHASIPGSSTASTYTFSSSVGSSHLIFAAFSWAHATGDTISCSDTLGSSFTVYGRNDAGTGESFATCYAVTTTSGSDTITVTFGTSVDFRHLAAVEYSGVNTSSPLDVRDTTDASPQSGSGTDNVVTHAITTTGNGDLILGAIQDAQGSATTLSAGTGFTERARDNDDLQIQGRIQSSAGSVAATWTFADPGIYYEGAIVAFKPASAGTVSDTSTNSIFTMTQGGAVTFQNESDSSSAFQVQNASGAKLFTIDTSAQKVVIGPAAGDAAGTILVLGNKTTSGDPTGVSGAMYYNATLAEFRCYADGAWRSCLANARTSYHYTNEMLSDISDNSLEFNHVGNGGSGYIDGEAGHPGIAQIGTGTNTPGTVWSYAGMVGRSSLLLGNGDYWRYETVLRLPTAGGGLSNGTDRYRVEAGFDDDAASDGVDGCYFKYSDNNNSGKWQGVCRSNSTESTCDVGITVATDTWYRLTVVVNSAGNSTDFQVNGVSKCQVTSNIPTDAGRNTRWGNQIIKDSGSSNRYIDMDYIDVQAQFGTSR